MKKEYVVNLEKVTKIYKMGKIEVPALEGISIKVKKGEFLCLMGPSGSGKSTCLNILGCLDKPTSGEYKIEDKIVSNLDDKTLSHVRNKQIGFVFQTFNLLARINAVDNVGLPLIYAGFNRAAREERSKGALDRVNLSDRYFHKPTELSGGQQQRVAIARAIVNEPSLILADEPTGNLDSKSGIEIMKIFNTLHKKGITIILITHEKNIAECGDRVLHFKDGKIE